MTTENYFYKRKSRFDGEKNDFLFVWQRIYPCIHHFKFFEIEKSLSS